MGQLPRSNEQVCVISPSAGFLRRIEAALTPVGIEVEHAPEARRLARHRRQRPFLVCFVDVRGPGAGARLQECRRARPRERFVPVLDSWQRFAGAGAGDGGEVFGFLREPFAPEEVVAWSRRAADENRLLQGEQSLEDVLYDRFRAFFRNLGSQPTDGLYEWVLEQLDRPLICAALESTGGNQSRAAKILGIHRNTLRAKLRTLGVAPAKRKGPRR
ncbi:MAG: hypothetical protein Kow0092_18050 [Deferrisomatales bacterium]